MWKWQEDGVGWGGGGGGKQQKGRPWGEKTSSHFFILLVIVPARRPTNATSNKTDCKEDQAGARGEGWGDVIGSRDGGRAGAVRGGCPPTRTVPPETGIAHYQTPCLRQVTWIHSKKTSLF